MHRSLRAIRQRQCDRRKRLAGRPARIVSLSEILHQLSFFEKLGLRFILLTGSFGPIVIAAGSVGSILRSQFLVNLMRLAKEFIERCIKIKLLILPSQFLRRQRKIKLVVLCGIYSEERIQRNYKNIYGTMPRSFATSTAIL